MGVYLAPYWGIFVVSSPKYFRGKDKVLRLTRTIGFVGLLLSLISPAISAEKTRILFVGGVEMPSGNPGGPFWHLEHDPFFELTPVRAMWLPGNEWGYEDNVMFKAVRLYMPRTYEDLVENYDVVSFFYASMEVIPNKYTKWISDAVIKGKGFMFVGHGQWAFDWTITTVADILPLDILNDQYSQDPTTIRITDHDHPITASLPWSSMGEHNSLAGHSYTRPRQSSEVLAELISFLDPPEPFLVWWEAGGRSIAMMTVFRYEDNPFVDWEFFPDLTSNLHLYAARRQIPTNPEILHQLRRNLEWFHWRSGMLVGTLEFLSKLGGNPTQVEQIMSRANERLKEVETLYLSYDFEAGLNLAANNVADLERAEELAMELKDRTLFWIYTIEWSTLTATSLVTGILLWALMMKRQFYTEVGTTKLAITQTTLLNSNPHFTRDDKPRTVEKGG